MNILIIGAGALGVALGASLLNTGNEVSYFTKGETKKAIDEGGLHRTGLFGDLDFGSGCVKTYNSYDDLSIDEYDYILVSAKTLANDEISHELNVHRGIMKASGKIVIVQNGWGNDIPYLRFFDKDKVYNARVISGFKRKARNVSEITVHNSPILLGSLHGYDSGAMTLLAKAINASGLPCEASSQVAEALWAKMIYNCTLNPLSAILRVNYGKLTESQYSIHIMDTLIDEIYSVINAAGYKTSWATPDEYRQIFYSKLVPDTYNHISSTLQDIEKKYKTEIDTLTGCIISIANEHGISVPYSKMIYNLIKSIEDTF